MTSPTDPSSPRMREVDLDVRGTVPRGLSGRFVGIGHDGVVHSLRLGAGRVSYRRRRFRTEAVVHQLVAFEGSMLAFGDDSPAYELSTELAWLRRVDLAGHGRALGACPKHDPVTGELHLVAGELDGTQVLVVISAGALTRRSRPIVDPPNRVADLAVTTTHSVFVSDGCVGVAPRDGDHRTTWITTGVPAPRFVHAHSTGEVVALLVLTPALERWVLQPATGIFERTVLVDAPRRFARVGPVDVDGSPRRVWTAGGRSFARHDLVDSGHAHHIVGRAVPGDFALVVDPAQPDGADGGWIVGFVHDPSGAATDLRVIDAADLAQPAVATVRIPRHVPQGLRCTWMPWTAAPITPIPPPTQENRP